jgi:hypothetical protein
MILPEEQIDHTTGSTTTQKVPSPPAMMHHQQHQQQYAPPQPHMRDMGGYQQQHMNMNNMLGSPSRNNGPPSSLPTLSVSIPSNSRMSTVTTNESIYNQHLPPLPPSHPSPHHATSSSSHHNTPSHHLAYTSSSSPPLYPEDLERHGLQQSHYSVTSPTWNNGNVHSSTSSTTVVSHPSSEQNNMFSGGIADLNKSQSSEFGANTSLYSTNTSLTNTTNTSLDYSLPSSQYSSSQYSASYHSSSQHSATSPRPSYSNTNPTAVAYSTYPTASDRGIALSAIVSSGDDFSCDSLPFEHLTIDTMSGGERREMNGRYRQSPTSSLEAAGNNSSYNQSLTIMAPPSSPAGTSNSKKSVNNQSMNIAGHVITPLSPSSLQQHQQAYYSNQERGGNGNNDPRMMMNTSSQERSGYLSPSHRGSYQQYQQPPQQLPSPPKQSDYYQQHNQWNY